MNEKPEICYRDSHGGHYIISRENDDGTVLAEHGGDSFTPGLHVAGLRRADLKPCNCGEWKLAHDLEAWKGAQEVKKFSKAVQLASALSPEERDAEILLAQLSGDEKRLLTLKSLFAAAERLEANTAKPKPQGVA